MMPLAQHATESFGATPVTLGLVSMLLPGMHLVAPLISKVLRDRAHWLLTALSTVGCFTSALFPEDFNWFVVSMTLIGLGWVRTNIRCAVSCAFL